MSKDAASNKPKTPVARRDLLRALGFGAGAAVAAAAPLIEPAAADSETADEKRKAQEKREDRSKRHSGGGIPTPSVRSNAYPTPQRGDP